MIGHAQTLRDVALCECARGHVRAVGAVSEPTDGLFGEADADWYGGHSVSYGNTARYAVSNDVWFQPGEAYIAWRVSARIRFFAGSDDTAIDFASGLACRSSTQLRAEEPPRCLAQPRCKPQRARSSSSCSTRTRQRRSRTSANSLPRASTTGSTFTASSATS